MASTRTWYERNAEVNISSAAFLALFAAPVVFFLWLLAQPGGETARLWFADIGLLAGALVASATCFLAARRYGGNAMGRAWAFLGLGLLAMAFGEAAWAVQELGMGKDVSMPSVADIGYVAFYPIIFIGLFTMPQAPISGLRRLKYALDIAICTGAIALISSHFIIQEVVRDGSSTDTARAIAIFYPLGDVSIVFATLVLAVRGGNHASIGMVVLALGFASIAVSDSLYTYLSEAGEYFSGSLVDAGWMLGYALIAMAGLFMHGRRLDIDGYKEDTDKPVPAWNSLALQAAIIPVAAILFTDVSGSTARVDVIALGGFIALGILASARQAITHHENARLNRQLEQITQDLKARLQTDRVRSMYGVRDDDAEDRPVEAPDNDDPPAPFLRPNFGE